MSEENIVISSVDAGIALAYFKEHVPDSQFVQFLSAKTLVSNCNGADLITSSPIPSGTEFASGFGSKSKPCKDWLYRQCVSYLQATPDGVVLFEDLVSLQTDPILRTRQHPSFWSYRGRLFWPVLSSSADFNLVREMAASVPGFRELIVFAKAPPRMASNLDNQALLDEEFEVMASSVNRIATDVFDQEGYLVWSQTY